ncbi:solute carrier organic anion transporter family member 74D-like isoform X2 [Penaeus japonicus]|uniref:solute carrier organic anion transporter family member 74D-like isoform X2 n=1 Tax=Penaeus japonicus TaxID=27405 RepID=UPI001C712549|nr:solute carrier organic anion transporter family member 74D-like isoform X2 [Penaeus japonicus]XP_042890873.1 solute carrier organic anion transporter family member 74D-like isoform X2 [Penaeus japonicus]
MEQRSNLLETGPRPTETRATDHDEVGQLLHDERDRKNTRCGVGPFKPSWLQVLARKEVYLLVYCIVGIIHGMFFTYTVSVISTIEKRFKLTSKQTGAILTGNDISQVFLSLFLSYYGNYGHRPRWMAVGVMLAAGSGFGAALPHFIYGPGEDAVTLARAAAAVGDAGGNSTETNAEQELCFSHPAENCGPDGSGGGAYVGAIILFFCSQFFVGIAVSIFYSIGVSYLDDNINKKTYPVYCSISFMLRILGPVLGFFVGGKCLSTWIDPNEAPLLTTEDPRWLGAWWIGYLFIGSGLIFSGSLLFLFPRKLPATLRREAKRVVRQAERDRKEGGDRGLSYFASLARQSKDSQEKPTLPNLKKALKRLFTNKIWVGNLYNTTVFVLASSGYWSFKPKYLENQFRKSSSEANYYTGITSLVSLVVGTAIGGTVLRWAQPGPRFVTGYNIFITLLFVCSYVSLMFIGCPKLQIIGPVAGSAIPDCSSNCGCSEKYSPVCSEDQTTLFYSPCFAGCTAANVSSSPIVYSNCRCVTNATIQDDYSAQNSTLFGSVTSGYCPEPCNNVVYYIILQCIVKTIASTGKVGSSLITLRAVSDEDKGLALGLMTVFTSLFGFSLGPVIMGAIIDSACLVWDTSCGKTGNCWLYDSDKFRTIIHLVPAVLVFVSVLGDLVVFYYSRQMDLYGDREDQVQLERARRLVGKDTPVCKSQIRDPFADT